MSDRTSRRQPCQFPGCGKLEYRFSGLCDIHYQQRERGLELRPRGSYQGRNGPAGRRGACTFPGCERLEHRFSGLCNGHYLQRGKGLELRPIGYYLEHKPRYVPLTNTGGCSIDECERPASKAGMCEAHYWQSRNGGIRPGPPIRTGEPLRRLVRDLASRDRSECWIDWPYATHVTAKDVRRPKIAFEGKSVRVAQLVVALVHGVWASHACHTCHVPACYNPAHLYPGDAATNGQDRSQRRLSASVTCHGSDDEPESSNGKSRP